MIWFDSQYWVQVWSQSGIQKQQITTKQVAEFQNQKTVQLASISETSPGVQSKSANKRKESEPENTDGVI